MDLTDHRLTIDAAFQYREIKDYIRRTTNNDSGRASSQNDGRVRNLGTDLSIRYTFKDAFFVGGNFSYIDMRSLTRYGDGHTAGEQELQRTRTCYPLYVW